MDRAYLSASRLLALLMVVLGLAMVVSTLASGGGPLAVGVVIGVTFAVLGGGRLWLAGVLGRPRDP